MRVDSLSLLLSMANVGAYSDVLVVDMVGGLVVGAVAERLGGKPCVFHVYVTDAAPRNYPTKLNIIQLCRHIVHSIPFIFFTKYYISYLAVVNSSTCFQRKVDIYHFHF